MFHSRVKIQKINSKYKQRNNNKGKQGRQIMYLASFMEHFLEKDSMRLNHLSASVQKLMLMYFSIDNRQFKRQKIEAIKNFSNLLITLNSKFKDRRQYILSLLGSSVYFLCYCISRAKSIKI